ncbi:MAG: hypothetical protein K0R26_1917 [Bacteroidota bacterium]|jgi:hypothetical protein|nr:hypothetical protein [Bacteroidota bacterium]
MSETNENKTLTELENSELIILIEDYQAKENRIKEVFTELATNLGFIDPATGSFKAELKKEDLGFSDILKIMGIKMSSLPMILLNDDRRDEFFSRFSAIKKLAPILESYATKQQ